MLACFWEGTYQEKQGMEDISFYHIAFYVVFFNPGKILFIQVFVLNFLGIPISVSVSTIYF